MLAVLLVLALMSSCASMMTSLDLNSAKERVKEHNYAEAINFASSALSRSEGENIDAAKLIVEIVEEGDAYYNDLVATYRQPNQENALAKIYRAYESLINLYDTVAKNNLSTFSAGGQSFKIEMKDYKTELDTARASAGTSYYNVAVKKMGEDSLAGYRQAYANLKFVKSIYSTMQCPFEDIDSRIDMALNKGTIDIYIVVPNDLKIPVISNTMGDFIQQSCNSNSEWVKVYYGPKIDTMYQAWEVVNSGESFLNSLSNEINNSNGVLDFGKEVGADVVIYATFDNLKTNEIKVKKNKDTFSGTTSEGEPYKLMLNWNRYSISTSLDYSYYVVDVNSGKTLSSMKNQNVLQDVIFYSGTYSLSPDIWSVVTTKDMTKLVPINDIKEYRYANSGLNCLAYRTNYSSAELELRDKTHFDEAFEHFKMNAQSEAQYMIIMDVQKSIVKAVANYI